MAKLMSQFYQLWGFVSSNQKSQASTANCTLVSNDVHSSVHIYVVKDSNACKVTNCEKKTVKVLNNTIST